jgi:hypothetical protein
MGPQQPFTFRIAGQIPEEVREGSMVVPAKAKYAGQQEVPNPEYSPRTGGSRYRQTLDIGTTERTVPERPPFNRSPAQVRADEIGMAQVTVPERIYSGTPTKQQSRWQYLTGSDEPGGSVRTVGGPQAVTTTDPKVAYNTLQSLIDYRSQVGRVATPEHLAIIDNEIQSLTIQLRQYAAYRGQIRPTDVFRTPYRPGKVRWKAPGLKTGAAAAAGTAALKMPPPPPRQDEEDQEQP